MPKRLSRNKLGRIRASRLGDFRHMMICIDAGHLPGYEDRREYLSLILASPRKLPSREEVRQKLRLRNKDRVAHRLFSIAPIDMTKTELTQLRKQKDRERKMMARRNAGATPRPKGRSEPWKALGIHKATWYRRKANGETRTSEPHETRTSEPLTSVRHERPQVILKYSGHSCRTTTKRDCQEGQQGVVDDAPDIDFNGSKFGREFK
jgi:hypothetical protein